MIMQLEKINSSAQHSLEPAPKDTSVSSQSCLEKGQNEEIPYQATTAPGSFNKYSK